ncbi:hypothetical protein T492DRAFT_425300 [Pavlovales sp. CCMP2436]|nr:hypothetical protein T492DRAFT_425300 [Pavlovales sp. CCMP2436]
MRKAGRAALPPSSLLGTMQLDLLARAAEMLDDPRQQASTLSLMDSPQFTTAAPTRPVSPAELRATAPSPPASVIASAYAARARSLSGESICVVGSLFTPPPKPPDLLLCAEVVANASEAMRAYALQQRTAPDASAAALKRRAHPPTDDEQSHDDGRSDSHGCEHGPKFEGLPRRTTPWTSTEDDVIGEAVSQFGCRWGVLAALLPGRTCASVRNRWHRLKLARRLREGGKGFFFFSAPRLTALRPYGQLRYLAQSL